MQFFRAERKADSITFHGENYEFQKKTKSIRGIDWRVNTDLKDGVIFL